MIIVHCTPTCLQTLKAMIELKHAVSEIVGVVRTKDQAKQLVIHHAKTMINEATRDGFASTREEAWEEYLKSCETPIEQTEDGVIIFMNHYAFAEQEDLPTHN